VKANCAVARGTFPFIHFVSDESIYPEVLNMFKIVNHAHSVFCAISFIQMVQVITGEVSAFETEFYFIILKGYACLNFAVYPRNRFAGIIAPATGTFGFLPQIGKTNSAVQSTGGD
jgi:hypothetical protein